MFRLSMVKFDRTLYSLSPLMRLMALATYGHCVEAGHNSEPLSSPLRAADSGDQNSAQRTGVRKHAAQKLPEARPPDNDLGSKRISDTKSINSIGLRIIAISLTTRDTAMIIFPGLHNTPHSTFDSKLISEFRASTAVGGPRIRIFKEPGGRLFPNPI